MLSLEIRGSATVSQAVTALSPFAFAHSTWTNHGDLSIPHFVPPIQGESSESASIVVLPACSPRKIQENQAFQSACLPVYSSCVTHTHTLGNISAAHFPYMSTYFFEKIFFA